MMLSWLFIDHYLITDWATAMVRAIWQGGIAFTLVWITLRLFPKINPTFRCWLWRLAYLKIFVSFLGIMLLPGAWLSVPQIPASAVSQVIKSIPVTQWIRVNPNILTLFSPNFSFFSVSNIWFILWISGAVWFGVRLVGLWRRNRNIGKRAYPIHDQMVEPTLINLYLELWKDMKIKRAPRLYLSDTISSPLLQGFIHPKIILPEGFASHYQRSEIKLMLAHELAHFKRGDLAWNWLPIIARWLFFFHPLVWLAEREWKQLHEICSDHLAIQRTKVQSADYGKVLLKVACYPAEFQPWRSPRNELADYYFPESKQTLKKRLMALSSPQRTPLHWSFISLVTLIFFGFITILPWKLSLPGFPSLTIRIDCSSPDSITILKINGGILHAGQMAIKKVDIVIDDLFYIAPWGYTSNTFEGYRGFVGLSEQFKPDGLHRIKLLVTTTSGIIQEKYDFYFNGGSWVNRVL